MSRDRLAPVGVDTPSQRCYFCRSAHTDAVMVPIKEVAAWGWRCVDVVACARRQKRRDDGRQEKLFMRNVDRRPAA